MIEILVDEIVPAYGTQHGIVVSNSLALGNVEKIVGESKFNAILKIIGSQPRDGFHIHMKSHQFVVLFNMHPGKVGLSMSYMEFPNVDNVLDEYLIMQEKGWDIEDRNKIMELAQEIISERPERAVLKKVALSP